MRSEWNWIQLHFNGGNGQAKTLNPGTYCGSLSVGGSTPLTLNPGVYVFTNSKGYGVSGGSAPQIKVNNGTLCTGIPVAGGPTGVTIYVKSSGNATVQFSGNQTQVYLIAPQPGTSLSSGESQGIAIWLDNEQWGELHGLFHRRLEPDHWGSGLCAEQPSHLQRRLGQHQRLRMLSVDDERLRRNHPEIVSKTVWTLAERRHSPIAPPTTLASAIQRIPRELTLIQ